MRSFINIHVAADLCGNLVAARVNIDCEGHQRNAAAITSVIGTRTVSNRMRIAKISMKLETRAIITYYVLPAAQTPRNT
ncbi:MAG: hypothetical protein CM15mP21_0770 [Hyphomicrobiales bacterium]|nr:MAG: hypothetical protein CM15mP21_0770 [Hyphomicrobiales bacterium]